MVPVAGCFRCRDERLKDCLRLFGREASDPLKTLSDSQSLVAGLSFQAYVCKVKTGEIEALGDVDSQVRPLYYFDEPRFGDL